MKILDYLNNERKKNDNLQRPYEEDLREIADTLKIKEKNSESFFFKDLANVNSLLKCQDNDILSILDLICKYLIIYSSIRSHWYSLTKKEPSVLSKLSHDLLTQGYSLLNFKENNFKYNYKNEIDFSRKIKKWYHKNFNKSFFLTLTRMIKI